MTRSCRRRGCDARAREDARDAHARTFCSPRCEVAHDHLRADARAARRDVAAELEGRR